MRLELVNPFVEASYDLVKGYWPDGLKKSDINLLDRSTRVDGISIVVGIANSPGHRVIVNMNDATGMAIASRMMEESVKEWDDISRSALGEFANMLCGLSVTKLEKDGLHFNIMPPSITWAGEGVVLDQESLHLDLETAAGRLRVIVSMDAL